MVYRVYVLICKSYVFLQWHKLQNYNSLQCIKSRNSFDEQITFFISFDVVIMWVIVTWKQMKGKHICALDNFVFFSIFYGCIDKCLKTWQTSIKLSMPSAPTKIDDDEHELMKVICRVCLSLMYCNHHQFTKVFHQNRNTFFKSSIFILVDQEDEEKKCEDAIFDCCNIYIPIDWSCHFWCTWRYVWYVLM